MRGCVCQTYDIYVILSQKYKGQKNLFAISHDQIDRHPTDLIDTRHDKWYLYICSASYEYKYVYGAKSNRIVGMQNLWLQE